MKKKYRRYIPVIIWSSYKVVSNSFLIQLILILIYRTMSILLNLNIKVKPLTKNRYINGKAINMW